MVVEVFFLTEGVITKGPCEASSSRLDGELSSVAVVGGGYLGVEEWDNGTMQGLRERQRDI